MNEETKPPADRGVAQSGSALGSGPRGRRFESSRPDQIPITPELVLSFWTKVQKAGPSECWLWLGGSYKGGYGVFCLPSHNVPASRYAYYLSSGHWPGCFDVLHSCDNPPCCNPAHLWLGFAKENARDMVGKGRHARAGAKGERNASAKLTEDDVRDIRRSAAFGETNVTTAARYGVSADTISLIRIGKRWKHVA